MQGHFGLNEIAVGIMNIVHRLRIRLDDLELKIRFSNMSMRCIWTEALQLDS